MSTDSIMGGSLVGSMSSYSFGSSSTSMSSSLDMTGSSTESQGSQLAASDKKTFGAQVVTATMNKLNTGSTGMGQGSSDLYDFNTKVLGAVYGGKGSIFGETV